MSAFDAFLMDCVNDCIEGGAVEDNLPADELARIAYAAVQTVSSALQDLVSAAGEITDPLVLADLLASCRDMKQDLARVYDEVEQLFLPVAGEKKLEVPSVGVVEVKSSIRRTRWQHDEVFRTVVARAADEPGIFYDVETGEKLPPVVMAANFVAFIRGVLSPSWKVTGLSALGIDADEFCETDERHYSVMLPPRAA